MTSYPPPSFLPPPPPPPSFPPPPLPPARPLLVAGTPVAWRWWHVAVAIGLFPAVGYAFHYGDIALGTPVHGAVYVIVGQLTVWGCVLAWLASVSRRHGTGSFRTDYGLAWRPPHDLWLGVAVGALAFVSQVVVAITLRIITRTTSATTSGIITDLRHDPAFWIIILLPIVGAPLVEELVFRGLTLRCLEREVSPLRAVVISAVLFGLFHWRVGQPIVANLELATTLGVSGVLLGLLASRYRRLGPSMVAHATINTIVTVLIISRP